MPPALKLRRLLSEKGQEARADHQMGMQMCESKFKAGDWRFGGNHKTIIGTGEQAFLVEHLRLGWCDSVFQVTCIGEANYIYTWPH